MNKYKFVLFSDILILQEKCSDCLIFPAIPQSLNHIQQTTTQLITTRLRTTTLRTTTQLITTALRTTLRTTITAQQII
jgi:hypothetical protein